MGSAKPRTFFVLVVLLLALAPAHVLAAPGMLVGVDDDTVKWLGRPDGLFGVYEDLGLGAVRVTIPWRRGDTRPRALQQTYLHRVAALMARGEHIVLAVYGRPASAPTTPTLRAQYCTFLSHVLRRLPVRDVVIWDEANSPGFWPSSSGAVGYERLLATCWDRLHSLRRPVNVISSTAAHHDPAGFIRKLGAAYRASERKKRLVDTFGHNPYPDNSAEAPWAIHASGTIGEGDLSTLLSAYMTAFSGTAQPAPGTDGVSVWYLEDGFQTLVPATIRHEYQGEAENDLAPVSPDEQSMQLANALHLAYCQPDVGAFFNFDLIDEDRLTGWQSGLLWRDGTKKPSYGAYKTTVAQVSAGNVDCSTVERVRIQPRR